METILALIAVIALEVGVPTNFVKAIAYAEHWNGSIEATIINPRARSPQNRNGTRDYGVMQLNGRYFSHIDMMCPEQNIRAGVLHIKWLTERPELNTWWAVAVAYNCGLNRMRSTGGPPPESIRYANRVLEIWKELDPKGLEHKTTLTRR
jgi:soluble lytic murein transglycosylase-like protein